MNNLRKGILGWPIGVQEPTPRPRDFTDRVASAAIEGRRLADETSGADTLKSLEIGREYLSLSLRQNVPEPHTTDAWINLYMTVFWFTALVRSKHRARNKPDPLPNWAWFGVLSQSSFSRALLGLTGTERQIISRAPETWDDPLERIAWRHDFTGAMSVSRTVRVLCELDVQVFLPVPEIDLIYKIDLVAEIPKTNSLLCLQIKRASFQDPSSAQRISDRPSEGEDPEMDPTRYGTQRLAREKRLSLIPAMVYAGRNNRSKSWAFDHLTSELHAALNALL